MRIIEPTTEAHEEYLLARAADISCTIRPYPGFQAEAFVTHYAGPPALIMWHQTPLRESIGWAIPYAVLDRRAAASVGLMQLINPKLVYIATPNGFGTGFQWLKRLGARAISPKEILKDKDQMFEKTRVDTIFATPSLIFTMMGRNMGCAALLRVVIFIGCETLSAEELRTIRAFFGVIEVTVVYWRAWAGIISMTRLDDMLNGDPSDCGQAVDGLEVEEINGALFARGPNVEGLTLLSQKLLGVLGSGWVPLLNTGRVVDGRVFVTGEVADRSQL